MIILIFSRLLLKLQLTGTDHTFQNRGLPQTTSDIHISLQSLLFSTLETYLANAQVIFFGRLDFLPRGNTYCYFLEKRY